MGKLKRIKAQKKKPAKINQNLMSLVNDINASHNFHTRTVNSIN
jgi:hypothetical protein